MHIVYASSSQIPSETANSIHTMKMCAAFASQGLSVTLLARGGTLNLGDDGSVFAYYGVQPSFAIATLRWPSHRWGGLIYRREARHFLEACGFKIDLVYGRSVHAVQAALCIRLPCVIEIHAPPTGLLRKLVERSLLRDPVLRAAVFISRALREEYVRLFPWLQTRVRLLVSPDGSDPSDVGAALASTLVPWPSRPGCLQVGYAGHFYQGKGVDLIVQVASLLPAADFHVLGGTQTEIASLTAKGLPRNLFLHGFVPPSDVSYYLQRFDVVLLPNARKVSPYSRRRRTRSDIGRWTSPLKLFEYMASGKAIIASDVPVLREILVDGVNCRLAPPEEPQAWASVLASLDKDRALIARLGEAAKRELLAKYTWQRRAAALLDDVLPLVGARAVSVQPWAPDPPAGGGSPATSLQ
jgi:glycosyltransferase involved in cell wall biosynthesis